MKIQFRSRNHSFHDSEIEYGIDAIELLKTPWCKMISFDFIEPGFRLVLYPDGTYQIRGGLVNYPTK